MAYEAVKSGSSVPWDPGILSAGQHAPQICGHRAAKRPPTCHRFPCQGRLTLGTAAPRHLINQAHACCRADFGEKEVYQGQGGPGKWPASKFRSQVYFHPTTAMMSDVFFPHIFLSVLEY